MGYRYDLPCPCGSELLGYPETDVAGIYLGRMCERCRSRKLRGYRPEVLDDEQCQTAGYDIPRGSNRSRYSASGEEETLEIDFDG